MWGLEGYVSAHFPGFVAWVMIQLTNGFAEDISDHLAGRTRAEGSHLVYSELRSSKCLSGCSV